MTKQSQNIYKLEKIASDLSLRKISSVVIDDFKFGLWPASSKEESHHHFEGGLLQHTLEVVELSLLNLNYFKDKYEAFDEKKLFLAALYHDIGKTYDYEMVGPNEWAASIHRDKIHHISRSAIIWKEAMKEHNFSDPNDEVLHAILSHHQLREWRSPVRPSTAIAWILHLSDSLSARVYDCRFTS